MWHNDLKGKSKRAQQTETRAGKRCSSTSPVALFRPCPSSPRGSTTRTTWIRSRSGVRNETDTLSDNSDVNPPPDTRPAVPGGILAVFISSVPPAYTPIMGGWKTWPVTNRGLQGTPAKNSRRNSPMRSMPGEGRFRSTKRGRAPNNPTKPIDTNSTSDPRVGVTAAHESAAAAMCVRLVDVSGILAIHIPTRSLLRSSSTHEPSDPPLRVVFI